MSMANFTETSSARDATLLIAQCSEMINKMIIEEWISK